METTRQISWTAEKVSRLWNYYASNSSYENQYFSNHSGKYILSYVRKRVNFKGKDILDFGCGPGYLLQYLSSLGINKMTGLDFSKESVDRLNDKFKGNKKFAGAVCVNSLPSSLDDASMDIVIAVEVVEHLSDSQLRKTLNEIHRLLKPGGHIIVTTPNNEDLEASKTICPECGCVFHRWQHIRSWNAVSLRELMEQYGFATDVASQILFDSPLKKVCYWVRRSITRNLVYPHLLYIGRKWIK